MMKSVTKEKVFHVLKQVLLAVTVTLVLLSLLGTVLLQLQQYKIILLSFIHLLPLLQI